MRSDIQPLVNKLVGSQVPRPAGTLSGHAAGLPFERLVHRILTTKWPDRCAKHYEILNKILMANPVAKTSAERIELCGPPSVSSLVSRGSAPMGKWTPINLFEEKQNDTAENILLTKPKFDLRDNEITLIDVKSHNNDKKGQPPNIMSAAKLANACKLALQEGSIKFDIIYVSVLFDPKIETLDCTGVRTISLFNVNSDIYINWTAAQQIQFEPHEVDQDFKGTKEQWARRFLGTFCDSLEKRIVKDKKRLAEYRSVL
jgi:hypothetical protein